MQFKEIKKLVIAEYDKRQLSSDVRYRALDDFELMLKVYGPEFLEDVSNFPVQKEFMKRIYEQYRNNQGLKMSQGASSMINEVYNQLNYAGVTLKEYKAD